MEKVVVVGIFVEEGARKGVCVCSASELDGTMGIDVLVELLDIGKETGWVNLF